MTSPETTIAGETTGPAGLASATAVVAGWGGGARAAVKLLRPPDIESLAAAVAGWRGQNVGAIARGMGRSYGDAAQLTRGVAIEMTLLRRIELDPSGATVTAEAGITIGELLEAVVPHGLIVPVVPGTQHVTLGGAIASDIHGKNHATAGTLGSHVRALGLLSASGELLELEPGSAGGLFEATLGGMGLTGVILWARVSLRRVGGSLLAVDTDRVADLDEALTVLSEPGGPHRVAWLDLLGARAGRGIVTRAEHMSGVPAEGGPTVRARATVPEHWPAWLLRPATVGAFNGVHFRRAPRRERGRLQSFGAHMFPLDGLEKWPRLYGRRGLVQYQLVVPTDRDEALRAVIVTLRRARVPCFLAVLKDFGPANCAPLSFPIQGWTLALDLPRSAPGLERALRRCDELVAAAGGRVYLTKDARLSRDAVEAMYARLPEWRAIRDRVDPDGLWSSDLALRTGLVER
jgi:decaprenylphospho-beta-D-ribofuranose 2-oxidase